MTPVRFVTRSLAVAITAIAAGCAPMTVSSFTERGVDIAAYRTFAWEQMDGGVPGDPRLDNNTVFHTYLRGTIERQLVGHGYEPTALSPDVRIHYHASSRQKIYVSRDQHVAERCNDCSVQIYDEGTLLVDITDARSGALLWRGMAESQLADTVNSQIRMEETIERVVDRIFSRLPRRL